jgi:hypothetical protein
VCDLDNNLFLNLYEFFVLLKQRKNENSTKDKEEKNCSSIKDHKCLGTKNPIKRVTLFNNNVPRRPSDIFYKEI